MTKKISTEERILFSAQQVFHNKGFAGARMQEIADVAQINKGLLHYYYKSKEKLFEKVFDIALKQMLGKLNEILLEDTDLFSKIRSIVDNYIYILNKNRFIPNFIFQEINRDPDFFYERFSFDKNKEAVKRFEKAVEDEIEKGNIIHISPKQLIINIISMSIFPFIAKPLATSVLDISDKEFNNLIDERRIQVAEFTINAIKI